MNIRGTGAKAYDAEMVTKFFEAGIGSKVTKAEAKNILDDASHELRDNFEGATSSAGLGGKNGMVAALKRTAKQLAQAGNLTAGAAEILAEFSSGDGELAHAVADIKSEVAYNRRHHTPPPRSRSHGT